MNFLTKNLILCKDLIYDIDAQVSRPFFANVIVLIKYKNVKTQIDEIFTYVHKFNFNFDLLWIFYFLIKCNFYRTENGE